MTTTSIYVLIGDYIISVKFNNEKIKGSPFVCKAFDTGNLIVSNMPNFSLPGNPVTFDSK